MLPAPIVKQPLALFGVASPRRNLFAATSDKSGVSEHLFNRTTSSIGPRLHRYFLDCWSDLAR